MRPVIVVLLTLTACAAEPSRPLVVSRTWSEARAGEALGQVSGVAVDAHGDVLLFRRADRDWDGLPVDDVPIEASTVLRFDGATGELLGEWGAGMFVVPHGLAVDARGHVWLTDVGSHEVFELSADGALLRTFGEHFVPGFDRDHFVMPTDVAVAESGAIYIADGYGNARIVQRAADGSFVREWGSAGDGPGQFDTPHGLAISPDGLLYVADRGNARVQRFTLDGAYAGEWSGPALGRPWAIAFAPDGLALVLDGGDQRESPPDRARIVEVALDGSVLGETGAYGTAPGQFIWPHDIAVGTDGSVYVVEVGAGRRAQRFTR